MTTITVTPTLGATMLTDIKTALDAGSGPAVVKLYTGTKPTDPTVAITSQVLLGTLTCSDPCGTVSGKTFTFSAITQDSAADNTGTATWARFLDSASNGVVDVDAGVTGSSAFFQMNTTSIIAGGPISCSACAITIP